MSGDGLTSTASAIITLEDVNDNAPGFTRDEVPPLSPHHQPLPGCPPLPGSIGDQGCVAGGGRVLWSRSPAQVAQRPELGAAETVLVSTETITRSQERGEATQTSLCFPQICAHLSYREGSWGLWRGWVVVTLEANKPPVGGQRLAGRLGEGGPTPDHAASNWSGSHSSSWRPQRP